MAGVHIPITATMVLAVRLELRNRGIKDSDNLARALIAASLRAAEIAIEPEMSNKVVVWLDQDGDKESARLTVNGPAYDFGHVKVQVAAK